jgi:hypothetical protein
MTATSSLTTDEYVDAWWTQAAALDLEMICLGETDKAALGPVMVGLLRQCIERRKALALATRLFSLGRRGQSVDEARREDKAAVSAANAAIKGVDWNALTVLAGNCCRLASNMETPCG